MAPRSKCDVCGYVYRIFDSVDNELCYECREGSVGKKLRMVVERVVRAKSYKYLTDYELFELHYSRILDMPQFQEVPVLKRLWLVLEKRFNPEQF